MSHLLIKNDVRSASCIYASQIASIHNGADVVAASGPLQLIVASLLSSYQDSKLAIQQVCNLLVTGKAFLPALQAFQGLLAVKFGPPVTSEAAAAFAGWLAKCGCLVDSLELQLSPSVFGCTTCPSTSQQSATELTYAAALQKAAAAGPDGLRIRSCKLAGAGLESAAILQALPGSTLTSLELHLRVPRDEAASGAHALMGRLSKVLPSLQQLHELRLRGCSFDGAVSYAPVLCGFGALTNLTSLSLPELANGAPLQHLPASLLELQLEMLQSAEKGALQLGHLTALTSLLVGWELTLRQHHVLPPNLLALSAGNITPATCLLPLKQLRQLTLHNIEQEVAPAAELLQLTSLTALTAVHLTYRAGAEAIDAAADGWRALKVRFLHLVCGGHSSLARDTLLRLTDLPHVQSLCLQGWMLDAMNPGLLALVIGGMHHLVHFSLCEVHWAPADDAAGNAAALAELLRGFAVRWAWFRQLTHLSLEKQHVNSAAAAALSRMRGLQQLTLAECRLEDSSVAEIASGLQPKLQELDLARNPQLTDACLPALADALPGLQQRWFRGCAGVTREGLEQHMRRVGSGNGSGSA